MNVYDFDNTIYDGESVVDFYFYSLRKHPRLIMILPKIVEVLFKYKACIITSNELLSVAENYVSNVLCKIDFESLVSGFWDKNQKKIKKFYLEQQKEDDVVLSASWSYLIEEACRRIGIKTVIASQIDLKAGKIQRLCFREKKVEIFKNIFPDAVIDNFYTDSMNDAPMFKLAKRIFLVKGDKIKEIKK